MSAGVFYTYTSGHTVYPVFVRMFVLHICRFNLTSSEKYFFSNKDSRIKINGRPYHVTVIVISAYFSSKRQNPWLSHFLLSHTNGPWRTGVLWRSARGDNAPEIELARGQLPIHITCRLDNFRCFIKDTRLRLSGRLVMICFCIFINKM